MWLARGCTYIQIYVTNAAQALSAYLFGSLSQWFGSTRLLGLSYALFGLAALGFGWAHGNFWPLAVLFELAGFAVGGIEAMESTAAAEILPADSRGTGYGLLGAANGIGDLVSSSVVGGLWAAFGAVAGFGFAATFNFLSVLLLVWFRNSFMRGQ